MNSHSVDTNFLAFRPDENVTIVTMDDPHVTPSTSQLYYVALVATPKLPIAEKYHSVHAHHAVICMQYYFSEEEGARSYGWVYLEHSTKQAIGCLLEEMGAKAGKWYKMLISYERQPY